MPRVPRRLGLSLLGALTAAQLGSLTYTVRRPAPEPGVRPISPDALLIGDSLDAVVVASPESVDTIALDTPKWTLLMSYSSMCAFCDSVAGAWGAYMKNSPDAIQLVVVSREPADSAASYGTDAGWSLPGRSLQTTLPANRSAAIAARTPWLFLFSPGGRLVYSGHGDDLPIVDSIVRVH